MFDIVLIWVYIIIVKRKGNAKCIMVKKMKYKYYEICLIKNDIEWYYAKNSLKELKELIDWAIEHNQEIKYIKGKVR